MLCHFKPISLGKILVDIFHWITLDKRNSPQGKYHYTAGLKFDLFGFSSFSTCKHNNRFSCLIKSNPFKLVVNYDRKSFIKLSQIEVPRCRFVRFHESDFISLAFTFRRRRFRPLQDRHRRQVVPFGGTDALEKKKEKKLKTLVSLNAMVRKSI